MNIKSERFEELTVGTELNSSLGTFLVKECIAMGRCCEVYRGEQLPMKRPIALKVFRRHQEYGGALQREVRFLSKVSKEKGMVEHLGELKWEGRDILVQELLTCTLRDVFLSMNDSLCSSWMVLTLTIDLLRGLANLHKNEIVHGDLKPLNLMWDAKTSTFKIIDFGLSFETDEGYSHLIQSKGYLAPECMVWNATPLVQRRRSVDRPGSPADIWSVGCIVFEGVTGKQLDCQQGGCINTEEAIRIGLRAVSHSFSQAFLVEAENFLIRCLQIIPSKRPSCGDLLNDPWLKQYHQPKFTDTTLLPSTVIRILNMEDSCNMVEDVLELCRRHGHVEGHHFEASLGSLYVQYRHHFGAESAQQALTKMMVNDRMLVVTFYSLISWREEDFY